jgi:hypothetical protein
MVIARIKCHGGLNYDYYSKFLINFVGIEFSFLILLVAVSRVLKYIFVLQCTTCHLFMKLNAYTDYCGKKCCAIS